MDDPAVVVAVRLAWAIVRDLAHGELGVDLIAILAIVGALLLGEPFAAVVIGVMLATGEALERYAQGRAQRELTALLGRAPREVQRYVDGPTRDDADRGRRPGDLLGDPALARSVPVDGMVVGSPAVLDESALTGESRQMTREEGDPVSSGTVNAGSSFDLRATAIAADSTYAGIVRLVKEAQTSKAPFVRLADRYALIFVPFTLAISAAAWLVSGDPVRGLAVLVVATPCPLLLAAPIAIVAGISRAARRGVIVKGGGPLEALARAQVVLFDKTGTLTAGRPRLATIEIGPVKEPGAVDQGSCSASGGISRATVATRARRVDRARSPGTRTRAVDARRGRRDAGRRGDRTRRRPTGRRSGRRSTVLVKPDCRAGHATSGAVPRSRVRCAPSCGSTVPSAARSCSTTRSAPRRHERSARFGGSASRRVVMVTGDNAAVADIIGSAIGVDAVLADRAPSEKVDAVNAERSQASGPIVMVGDGLNDAPALALADVGVAMGARGASASSRRPTSSSQWTDSIA